MSGYINPRFREKKMEHIQPKSEVFNRDCLEMMRGMADNAFDLALVDCPYGIGMDGGKTYQKPSRPNAYNSPAKHQAKTWDTKPSAIYWKELFRVSKNQIIFGANYFAEYLSASMGWVFWDKNIGGDYSDGEMIYTSFNKALRKYQCHPFLGTNAGKNRIHPTEKPTLLYKWLLTNYAKQGDTILDSHMGSQSSRIAAWDLGFDYCGFELDADYYKVGCERFERHCAQGSLFVPTAKTVTQESLF